VIKRQWYAAAVLVAACGGSAPPGRVGPAPTASAAVQSFMQAVADSDLAKMATLWGTAKGPASKTRTPPDYERRVAIMQAYLASDDYRILGDAPEGSAGRHALQVQLRRQACTYTVPFTVIQLADTHWIINEIDLTAAGNPKRPCSPEQADTGTTGP
jgi:hypothetical protein